MSEVAAFREKVRVIISDMIKTRMPSPADTPITQDSPWWGIFLAFEHEKIHLETSSVLMRQLPIDDVSVPQGWRYGPSFAPAPADAPANKLVEVPATTVTIGKPLNFPSFGWDNEYGRRVVPVPAFSSSAFLVSNAEFLPFVEGGGYDERKWWVLPSGDDEGWRWRTYRNARHPSFWVASSAPSHARFLGGKPENPLQRADAGPHAATDGAWRLRAEFEIIDMPWDWPVEVNYLEAQAFLSWKAAAEGGGVTYRVLTEAEFHAARADPCPFDEENAAASAVVDGGADDAGAGARAVSIDGAVDSVAPPPAAVRDAHAAKHDVVMQATAPGNLNWRWHSPTPVNFYGPSPRGLHDMHGNVWQWVEDHFAPLPGFEIHYLYDDFSAPCFDGWHTMILGGSWVSSGNLASSFARYHFRRHFFQHLGFRYVRVEPPAEAFPGVATVTNLWEGQALESADITAGFTPAVDRSTFFAKLLPLPPTAYAYPAQLAETVSRAHAAHSVHTGFALSSAPAPAESRVLHLGCGVGAATFALCKAFGSVTGVDVRETAIRHARIFQHHGQFEYERVREGVLSDTVLANVDASPAERARAEFVLADATALPAALLATPYDVVVLDSLLARLKQPLDLVRSLAALVRPGGTLVIASSNDWDPAVTPRNSWIGGFKMNGEDCSTLRMLQYLLKRTFTLTDVRDVPRLTTVHDRKITVDIMQCSEWKRHWVGEIF